ncbi:MAG: ABC transporter A family member [Methanobacteriaceae archaeon]|nr:ABC transporter A family member [Methanobacteriaceae archaeon]
MEAIKTKNLTKKYKNKTAVNNLNLTIHSGEIFALLGVNGAGKTTTIKMLSCLTPPTTGDAILLGKSINKNSQEIKEKINISPQETAVALNLTVKENLELITKLYNSSKKESQEKTKDKIQEFNLKEVENNKAKTLSGGMQRRLSIAMALISNPEILFLDEPTLGLDVLARRDLWKLIKEIKGKTTIILTTHYMEEAEELSDRVGIMENGKIKDIGTSEELIQKTNSKNFEDAFVKIATGDNL